MDSAWDALRIFGNHQVGEQSSQGSQHPARRVRAGKHPIHLNSAASAAATRRFDRLILLGF